MTAGPVRPTIDRMDGDDTLDPRETERLRRRDREAEAERRALLRPGMGKVFKQIQDAQKRAADADAGGGASAATRRPQPRRPRRST